MINLKEYIIEGIFDVEDNIDNMDESIREEIKQFLNNNFKNASKCKISDKSNNNGKYEVSSNGGIEVKNPQITSLTNGLFIWTNIKEYFFCINCTSLTSLDGAPKEVGGNFMCHNCTSLTSLKGAPEKVGGDFRCSSCTSLQSLEGAPKEVGGEFYCDRCTSLKSLEGAPEKVGRIFYCDRCTSLKSLKGAPKEVEWHFSCRYCTSLTSLEGAPKEVGRNFYCNNCKVNFSEEDVKKISNVKGDIIV